MLLIFVIVVYGCHGRGITWWRRTTQIPSRDNVQDSSRHTVDIKQYIPPVKATSIILKIRLAPRKRIRRLQDFLQYSNGERSCTRHEQAKGLGESLSLLRLMLLGEADADLQQVKYQH